MSIRFIDGDLLADNAEILVNTVNCKGVMGAGIAKQFKIRYPKMFVEYKEDCKNKLIIAGNVYEYEVEDTPRQIPPRDVWNAATKYDWKEPSSYYWTEMCLDNICTWLEDILGLDEPEMPTIAMPALGCGNGGLDFSIVKEQILFELSSVKNLCDIRVYNPR